MKTKNVWLRHPSEDALENYARHKVNEVECGRIEEHLLACDSCQYSLQEIDDFISAFKESAGAVEAAQAEVPRAGIESRIEPDRSSFRDWVRSWRSFNPGSAALAGATALLCAAALLHHPPSAPQTPAAVTLTAFRGGDPAQQATVPAGRAVALALEVPDVSAGTLCRVEVVDAKGRPIWSGTTTATEGRLHLTEPEGLSTGNYWVRLYTRGSEPIREFGLLVK